MSSTNQATKNVDPFARITIRSVGADEGNDVKKVDYPIVEAIRVGELRPNQALGFSINGSYFGFSEPMDLRTAALDVLALASQYGSISGEPIHVALKIIESYFLLVQDKEEEVPSFDAVPTHVMTGRINDAYVGHFYTVNHFLQQMREDYKTMDAEDFAYRISTCIESSDGYYFEGLEEWFTEE